MVNTQGSRGKSNKKRSRQRPELKSARRAEPGGKRRIGVFEQKNGKSGAGKNGTAVGEEKSGTRSREKPERGEQKAGKAP